MKVSYGTMALVFSSLVGQQWTHDGVLVAPAVIWIAYGGSRCSMALCFVLYFHVPHFKLHVTCIVYRVSSFIYRISHVFGSPASRKVGYDVLCFYFEVV